MTRAKHKPSKSTSHLIQFRWNEKDEWAMQALEELEHREKKDKDFTSRGRFFADAVLNFIGRPIPRRSTLAEVSAKLDRVLDQQAEFGNLLIAAIQNGGIDPAKYINPENGHSLQDDLGEQIPQDVYEQMFSGVQGKKFDVD